MNATERQQLARDAAQEAWLSAESPSRAIVDTFDDEDLTPTEDEISDALNNLREYIRS